MRCRSVEFMVQAYHGTLATKLLKRCVRSTGERAINGRINGRMLKRLQTSGEGLQDNGTL